MSGYVRGLGPPSAAARDRAPGVLARAREAAYAPYVLVAIALLVRVAYLAIHRSAAIDMDGAEFARLASNLVSGHGYVGIRGYPTLEMAPLYPLLIAAVMTITHNAEVAALVVSTLVGSALVGVVYAIGASIAGRAAAVLAAAIVAVLPIEVQLSTTVLADALFTLVTAIGLLGLLRVVRSGKVGDGVLCAAGFGCAYLTRQEGALFIVVAVIAVTIVALRERRGFVVPATVAVVGFVFVLPLAAFGVAKTGHPVLEAKSTINFALAAQLRRGTPYLAVADAIDENGRPIGPEIDTGYYVLDAKPPTLPLRERLTLMASAAAHHIHDIVDTFSGRDFGFGLLLVLTVIGLTARVWPRARRRDEFIFFAMLGASYLALTSVWQFWPRYAAPFVVIATIWSARGILGLRRWSTRSGFGDLGTALAIVLIGASLAVDAASARSVDGAIDRSAGAWLAAHAPAHALVVDVSDRVAYYGGADWTPLPYGSPAAATRYLDRLRPAYVVIDSSRANDYPPLAPWFAGAPPHTTAVYRESDAQGRTLTIYRWQPG